MGPTQGLKNLEALFDQSDHGDRFEGRLAYRRYRRVLRRFADFYGFGLVPTVEAFAALSPNNDYHGNLRSLASVLDGIRRGAALEDITVSTYRSCAKRAWKYATGEVSFLDTVGGRKITAFRHNLLYPRSSTAVTVDGHMFAAWAGEALTMKEAALRFGRSDAAYDEVSDGITRLARRNGYLPCEMQATLWITRKRVTANRYTCQLHFDHGMLDLSRVICRPEDYPPYR